MLYEQYCSVFKLIGDIAKKVNRGLIAETGDMNEILESYQFHAKGLPNFILLLFCTWSGEGPHFYVKLEMCCFQFHTWTNR